MTKYQIFFLYCAIISSESGGWRVVRVVGLSFELDIGCSVPLFKFSKHGLKSLKTVVIKNVLYVNFQCCERCQLHCSCS